MCVLGKTEFKGTGSDPDTKSPRGAGLIECLCQGPGLSYQPLLAHWPTHPPRPGDPLH